MPTEVLDPAERLGNFEQRADATVDQAVELLIAEPERPVSPESKERILAFAGDLLDGKFSHIADVLSEGHEGDPFRADDAESLTTLNRRDMTARRPNFALNFLVSQEGRDAFGEQGVELPLFDSDTEARDWVLSFDFSHAEITDKEKGVTVFEELANKSASYAEKQAAAEFAETGQLNLPERVQVVSDPEALLQQTTQLLEYKKGLKAVRRAVMAKEVADDESAREQEAMLVVLNIHQRRANAMLAELYPDFENLGRQVKAGLFEGDEAEEFSAALSDLPSAAKDLYEGAKKKARDRFITHIDYIRNGVGTINGRDKSAISERSHDYFATDTEHEPVPEGVFTREELARIEHQKYGAETILELEEMVLTEWGMLSEYDYDDPNINGWAPDQRIRVGVEPKAKNNRYSPVRGTMEVKAAQSRGIADRAPAGVVPLAAHELDHGVQMLSVLATRDEQLPIAIEVRGASSSPVREALSIIVENETQRYLFGQEKPLTAQFMHAMEAIEHGADEEGAITAYYRSMVEEEPEIESSPARKETAMKEAINRTQRLLRFGGVNSQPLAYVEQSMIVETLEQLPSNKQEQARRMLMVGSAYSLADMVRLHRVGMMPDPSQAFIPEKSAAEIMEPWVRAELEAAAA